MLELDVQRAAPPPKQRFGGHPCFHTDDVCNAFSVTRAQNLSEECFQLNYLKTQFGSALVSRGWVDIWPYMGRILLITGFLLSLCWG
jgi:hypothetical protein